MLVRRCFYSDVCKTAYLQVAKCRYVCKCRYAGSSEGLQIEQRHLCPWPVTPVKRDTNSFLRDLDCSEFRQCTAGMSAKMLAKVVLECEKNGPSALFLSSPGRQDPCAGQVQYTNAGHNAGNYSRTNLVTPRSPLVYEPEPEPEPQP
jgi:hypothetical protein